MRLLSVLLAVVLGTLSFPSASVGGEEASSPAVKVLVTYHSLSGHTERMAEAVASGAKELPGTQVIVKRVQEVTSEDLFSSDAIVVGSGISGGWAAKELCERGLRTLVLEAGRPIQPAADYVEHVQAWELGFRGWGDRRALERDQPVQRKCYACDEWASKFFVNDRENPYSTEPGTGFDWIRGRHVGGRSIMWGRQVYRWSDLDFEANARDGIAVAVFGACTPAVAGR